MCLCLCLCVTTKKRESWSFFSLITLFCDPLKKWQTHAFIYHKQQFRPHENELPPSKSHISRQIHQSTTSLKDTDRLMNCIPKHHIILHLIHYNFGKFPFWKLHQKHNTGKSNINYPSHVFNFLHRLHLAKSSIPDTQQK